MNKTWEFYNSANYISENKKFGKLISEKWLLKLKINK